MPNSSNIRTRIKNIQKTKKITRAMYLISSMKIKKVQKQLEQTKHFFSKINQTLYSVINQSDIINSFYVSQKEKKGKKAYIVVTGDNGLAGDYNNSIVKAVQKHVKDKENSILLVVGYMGKNNLRNLKYNIYEDFEYFVHNPTILRTTEMTDKLIQMYSNAKISELYIIYDDLINSFKYQPKIKKLLPIDIEDIKKDIGSEEKMVLGNLSYAIKYEPSAKAVFENVIPLYLKGILYSILVDAYVCEQSARIIAMDEATKNASKVIKKLKTSYNKERQYRITKELTELVSGVNEN